VAGAAAALIPTPEVVLTSRGKIMFATTIRYAVKPGTDWEHLRQSLIRRAFDTYRFVPGLRSKAFVLSPEREECGGNFVWETQDDAEAFLRSDLFRATVAWLGEPSALERAQICAYLEEGDLLFPPDYDVQTTIAPDASVPPLGL
jgi:hypothetical protein